MKNKTNRQKIKKLLDGNKATAKTISSHIGISEEEVYNELSEIRKEFSKKDKTLFGSQPQCNNCGFSNFRKISNIPSKCPRCKSNNLKKIEFTID